jgi:acylphosphatase
VSVDEEGVPPVRRVHVVVSGRVQGVFFRATCAERARHLGLTGWVRNAERGNVEAVFEGGSDAVEAMVEWCRRGPSAARVQGVDVRDEVPDRADARAGGFDIVP